MKDVMLITGGSDGLGKTIAKYFCKKFKIVVLSKNDDKMKYLADEIKCDYHICDVRDFDKVELVLHQIVSKYGKIDVLINSAGLLLRGDLSENSFENIQELVDVNLTGLINVTKSVLPFMKKQNGGTIVNINSQGGVGANSERSVYNASKWGVTGFSKCLSYDVEKYGIKVVDIFPGLMKTDIFKKIGVERNMDNGIDTIEVAKLIEFILNLPPNITIPEVGIRHLF